MSLGQQKLLAAGLIVCVLTLPFALFVAPADAVQGEAQRLMYLHVPAAWSAFLCFGAVLVASLRHLFVRRERPWVLARAAAEAGVILTGLTLLTGSLWGALTWGTWWAWDARVITTVAMGLVYVVYLAVSGLVRTRSRRWASVIGILGFLTVPLVHFSVLWWRTLHQPPTILAPSLSPPIDPLMGVALAAALLGFTLWTAGAVSYRAAALRAVAAEGAAAPGPEGETPATTTGRELMRR
ncbi:cytochrome c biogenesis protein CcsA [Citricoccus nitrophenolicus]|uniref:Heme exporter protein C n=1 Tax=Citricoccus nitrophenolicus TaxID=863575 RepID=A0ABV0IKS9_9MICC